MCGIVGYIAASSGVEERFGITLDRMVERIVHRGPDSAGCWVDSERGVALGHRRLAIVDLSPAGMQPMASSSGRYVIVFNGEIYNHIDLRQSMAAQTQGGAAPRSAGAGNGGWRGHSDTETLLAGFECWGIADTLKRCVGMFALAVWDRERQELSIARDRLGEKPLYYGWQGQGRRAVFLFGSELKALRVHSEFPAAIDRSALCLLMRHSYIPAPYTIYEGISKLEPGCLLTVSMENREAKPSRYWSVLEAAIHGSENPFSGTAAQAVDELERLLQSAIDGQMIADVPLGAFLSGGIDSSTVVALMQARSQRPVKTFTIGFSDQGYNEAVHAKAVAAHLGTDHTELYVTPTQALDVIPRLPGIYCEPFSDSSQIPTFLVAQLARQKVTVSLSGDGGDELFCGYNRYLLSKKLWGKIAALPQLGRHMMSRGFTALSPSAWDALIRPLNLLLSKSLRQANAGEKLHKAATVLSANSMAELYLRLVSQWQDPEQLVMGAREPLTLLTRQDLSMGALDDIQRMMLLDTMTYLPDDILVKLDRAAMAVSLEGRVPFLDHRVVEFAMTLPQDMKVRAGVGKWPLRQVLYKYVPSELIERSKMGFAVPVRDWLRGPLRGWAESLLDEKKLREQGYLNPEIVQRKWADLIGGAGNAHHQIWTVLMFQAWLEEAGQA